MAPPLALLHLSKVAVTRERSTFASFRWSKNNITSHGYS